MALKKGIWCIRQYDEDNQLEEQFLVNTEANAERLICALFLQVWADEDPDVWRPEVNVDVEKDVLPLVKKGSYTVALGHIQRIVQEPKYDFCKTWTWDYFERGPVTNVDHYEKQAMRAVERREEE